MPDGVDSRSAVFDASLDAIITVNHEGRILEFNAAAEQIFGFARADVCGLLLAETIVPERLRDAHQQGMRRYLETGKAAVLGRRIDMTGRRADGSEFPIELAITRVPMHDPPLFTGFIRDLTDRRRLERRRAASYQIGSLLANSESLDDVAQPLLAALCEAFDAASAGLWIVDGDVLQCSQTFHAVPTATEPFGEISRGMRFNRGDGLPGRILQTGRVHWIADVLDDDSLLRGRAAMLYGLRAAFGFPVNIGTDTVAIIELFRPKVSGRDDDLVRLCESVGHQVAQFVARRRAEREREQLAVREHQARVAAEAADRAKDEFLAVVSHELRTPLNAVLGWTAMLKSGTLSDEKREKAIEAIDRSTRGQAQIIEDLLDATRIIRGRLTLVSDVIDCAAVTRAAVDTVHPSAQLRGVSLEMDDAAPAMVSGDPGRLQQVVWSLISNAVKFTPSGGVVRVAVQGLPTQVQIVVSDTGAGIAADVLPHIFERLRQGHMTGSTETGGLGLGLAIASRLVELHGGVLSATSEGAGKGSVFTVTLPLASKGNDVA
jgi:PAS domain S-box-containing protein